MQTSALTAEWCWAVGPGLLMDETQLQNELQLTPDVLKLPEGIQSFRPG